MPLLLVLLWSGCLVCRAFTLPNDHSHDRAKPWLTRRSLYVDQSQDVPPNVVVPEVMPRVPHRHALIKEWNPRPPPSYMTKQRDDGNDSSSRSNANTNVDHLFDKYVTVSQQEPCDAHDLQPKLERTAPVQPATPSHQEMVYATLKDVVVNHAHYAGLAAPVDFNMYMTVTDEMNHGMVVPPTEFVDANIEETRPDFPEETAPIRNGELHTSWHGYGAASTLEEKEQQQHIMEHQAHVTHDTHNVGAPPTSHVVVDMFRSWQINNDFAQQWREKYLSPDQPTMKELAAEYYWNQELLHQQQQLYQQQQKNKKKKQQQQWKSPASTNPFWMRSLHQFTKEKETTRDMEYSRHG